MFNFLKKKKSIPNTNADVEEFKKITQDLYKKNLEIVLKSKILSILEKLYEISILNLTSSELSERICSAIAQEFSFELVGIYLLNENKVFPVAISESIRIKNIETEFNTYFKDMVFKDISVNLFLNNLFVNKTIGYTENIDDIYDGMIPIEMQKKILSHGNIKSSIFQPILAENKLIGFFVVSTNRVYNDLVDYEKESIKNFSNVISVALSKAFFYERLKITNIKLADANAGQTNLIHIMNHQIKGYLSITKNIFAELLTDDYGKVPEEARDLISQGLENADKGTKYVTAVLKGESAENGKLVFDMKPFDLKKLATEVVAKEREIAEKKGLKLDFDVDGGDYNMMGDIAHLGEAVRNLIDNSINYTPSGSISVNLSIVGKNIVFKVKDTGVGVKEEDKSKLFKAGGVGSDSIKINVNSSGYGLAFVKGVIENHKGKVWFESEGAGKGSTFYIELPVK